jgi:glycerophosphoryl diester phosphodiesterase
MNDRIISLLVTFGVLTACQKQDIFPQVEVIGHAGAGLDVERVHFPGNTQESLNFAANLGVAHVEVDLHLSADNRWMLFHDDFLELRTNFSGCIRNYTKSELEGLRFLGFPNVGLQSLIDTDFSSFDFVFLDIRHYDACADFALLDTALMHQDVLEVVQRFPNQRFVLVSRRVPVLNHFKDLGLEVCHEVSNYAALETSGFDNNFDFFALRNAHISKEEIAAAQGFGWRILLFDVKSHAGNRSAMKKKPNFVMTDALVSALELTK